MYDHTWRIIRTIGVKKRDMEKNPAEETNTSSPKNDEKHLTCVAVHKDGHIHTVISGENKIHVFNPDNWDLVRSVTVRDRPIHEIYCLSSGDLVVRSECTSGTDICLVDYSGDVKETLHIHGKDKFCSCTADPTTGSVFILYFDRVKKQYAIDVVSFSGGVNTYNILGKVTKPSGYGCFECLVLESGTLVTLIYETITQYKLRTESIADILNKLKE